MSAQKRPPLGTLTNTPTPTKEGPLKPDCQPLGLLSASGAAANIRTAHGLLSSARIPLTPSAAQQSIFIRRGPAPLSMPARQHLGLCTQPKPPDAVFGSGASSLAELSDVSSPLDDPSAAKKSLSFDGADSAPRQPWTSLPPRRPDHAGEVQAQARVLVLEGQLRELRREKESISRSLAQLVQRPAAAAASTQTDVHPIFGECIADLGFKRLYLSSARRVVNNVPIWSRQRACNEGRVNEIVKAKSAA